VVNSEKVEIRVKRRAGNSLAFGANDGVTGAELLRSTVLRLADLHNTVFSPSHQLDCSLLDASDSYAACVATGLGSPRGRAEARSFVGVACFIGYAA
jgi:hypothetical protein